MSHKTWTFTTYENGKPVATATDLSHDEALVVLRAAIDGRPVLTQPQAVRDERPVEFAHAA